MRKHHVYGFYEGVSRQSAKQVVALGRALPIWVVLKWLHVQCGSGVGGNNRSVSDVARESGNVYRFIVDVLFRVWPYLLYDCGGAGNKSQARARIECYKVHGFFKGNEPNYDA